MRQFAIAFALLVTIAGTTLSAATYRVNGQFISFAGMDTSGCVWTYLSANRTSSGTILVYDLQNFCEPDPSAQTIAHGFGTIPNAALTFTKTHATLAVTIANSTTFTAEGLVGSINVTLTRNGFSTSTFSGQSRVEFDGVLIRSHGTRSEQSASVNGDVLGYTLTDVFGTLGSSQDLYIEVVPQ
jgi:hypothetical protein